MRFPLVALAASGLALLLLASAGPVYRLGMPLAAAVTILRWAAFGGLGTGALALLALGYSAWRGRRGSVAASLLALTASGIAFGLPYYWMRLNTSLPPIHDISTDLENPPMFVAVLPLRKDAPTGVEWTRASADQQRTGYPNIQPVTLMEAPGAVFDRALQVAQDMGWRIVAADRSAGRLEATATTRWFAFQDDVAVRFTAWGSGTRVDVRSTSRAGAGDLGRNAARIQAFLTSLQRR